MAKQLGQSKGEFLSDETAGGSLAVKLASAETLIIAQTKAWLKRQYEALDFEKLDRKQCKRSKTILLVKNLPATARESELKELFDRYGSSNLRTSPINTLAIVEYAEASQAAAALRNLAYHKVNYLTPIYLEYAPVGNLDQSTNASGQPSGSKQLSEEAESEDDAKPEEGDEDIGAKL